MKREHLFARKEKHGRLDRVQLLPLQRLPQCRGGLDKKSGYHRPTGKIISASLDRLLIIKIPNRRPHFMDYKNPIDSSIDILPLMYSCVLDGPKKRDDSSPSSTPKQKEHGGVPPEARWPLSPRDRWKRQHPTSLCRPGRAH